MTFLSFHTGKEGPLRDPQLRRALHLILKPYAAMHVSQRSYKEIANGFLFEHDAWVTATPDPLMIAELLASYQGETLRLHTFDEEDHREDASWIQSACATYGITIEPYFYTPEELVHPAFMERADLIHDSATIDDPAEISFLDMLCSGNSLVRNHLDAEAKDFIQQQLDHLYRYSAHEERTAYLEKVEAYLLARQLVLPLYRIELHVVSRSDLEGVALNALGWLDYRHLWFRKRSRP